MPPLAAMWLFALAWLAVAFLSRSRGPFKSCPVHGAHFAPANGGVTGTQRQNLP